MKTFAEYLPTMTTRERDIVRAFADQYDHFLMYGSSDKYSPIELMRSTPPAKEPVSVDLVLWHADNMEKLTDFGFTIGDRVRVVKIEEPT